MFIWTIGDIVNIILSIAVLAIFGLVFWNNRKR